MGEPITWRNIPGNGLENAWRPMAGAVDTFNSGFDRLLKVISDRQEANQGVLDRGRAAQVLDAKEMLGRITDPNKIAEVQPQIDAIRASLPAQYRLQLLGAEEARNAAIQDQFTKKVAYDHAVLDEQQAPLVQEFKRMQAENPAMAQFWLKESHPELRNAGELALQAHAAAQGNEKFRREGAQSEAQIQRWKDETLLGNRQVDETARGHDISLFGALSGGDGAAGRGGAGGAVGNPDGNAQAITTGIMGLFKDDPGKGQVMSRLVAEAMSHKDPKTAGLLRLLPQDVVLRAVEKHMSDAGTGKYNPFDLFAASNIQKTLLGELENPSVQQEMARDAAARIRAAGKAELKDRQLQAVSARLFPGSGTPAAPSPATADSEGDPIDESGSKDPGPSGAKLDANGKVISPLPPGIKYASLRPVERAEFNPEYFARKLAEEQGKVPATQDAMPDPAQATLRLTSPADSPAGKYQARVFAEQQAAGAAAAPARAAQAERERAATEEARRQFLEQTARVQRQQAQTEAQLQKQRGQEMAAAGDLKARQVEAQTLAERLLAQGNPQALARFQLSPGFDILDRETKAKVFKAVTGKG